ncbi:MAG: Crp/Fnr family transcriptional regulator [Thermodesulfobacteriota bacterium]
MVDTNLLRSIPFFAELTDDELSVVAGITAKKHFSTGEAVFNDAEEGHSLYIIRKGEVKVCKRAPDGELFTLTILKDGEIFGEMSFLDERPHSATMVAVSDVETYVIQKPDFDGIVNDHPQVIYKILKNIVFTIHAIVRGMNSRYIEMVNYMWGRKRGT